MSAELVRITGDIRDYAWGEPGGISRALGRPATADREAELWLGAHPSAPSRLRDGARWADLAAWEGETGRRVPFLLKILSASSSLSLQAHPTPDDAAAGFARENAAGIPLDARERNYKDPFAKPELIVALEDGFEALCGFRPLDQAIADVAQLAADAPQPEPFTAWLDLLRTADGVRASFVWLLEGGPVVDALVAGLTALAAARPDRWELSARLADAYPADPGIAVSLMLNHVTLAAGEALWLPAGNIHAYLRGTGVELMGPSDNVLRGGLTPKHVDIPELTRVLDFTPGPPPRLPALPLSEHTKTYRPRTQPTGAAVPFELLAVTGDAEVTTGGPAIVLVVDGAFEVTIADTEDPAATRIARGEVSFVTDAATLRIRGTGRLFLAAV